jgi:hypothetical protein
MEIDGRKSFLSLFFLDNRPPLTYILKMFQTNPLKMQLLVSAARHLSAVADGEFY